MTIPAQQQEQAERKTELGEHHTMGQVQVKVLGVVVDKNSIEDHHLLGDMELEEELGYIVEVGDRVPGRR